MNAPPPPPPHGEVPKSSGLPPGNYDIFIIPPHSSGSGFLYLPSLQPNVNSFVAGFASALVVVALCSAAWPAVQLWYMGLKSSGGSGVFMLVLAVGLGAWALGRTQGDGPGPGGGRTPSGGGGPEGPHPFSSHEHTNGHAPRPNGYTSGAPPPPPNGGSQAPPPRPPPQSAGPKPTWARSTPPPRAAPSTPPPKPSGTNTPKSTWEKAREETKRKEDERKAAEEAKKRKEENERRLKELREKDARERAERERKAKEREQEIEKKLAAEKAARDAQAADSKPKGSTYAFSSTGEKTNPWPNGRPTTPVTPTPRAPTSTPTRPPAPTARTYRGTEEDAYSFRPYDKPKTPVHKKAPSSVWSESSYAPSQSTSRTTPPPSHRGPYSTKDPDKIVLKAVYSFNNAFLKTPTSQLVSGVGAVTDGLILRITTEGLFIDDDVRGVPQREWDVKAWTMKLVEVWCPAFSSSASISASAARNSSASARPANPVRRLWNLDKEKIASAEEADALLLQWLATCKETCRFGSSSDYSSSAASSASDFVSSPLKPRSGNESNRGSRQTGKNEASRLHILRASIRDQEGKKYVFILTDEEAWKVSVGLGKLRKGSQVRALGVSAMSANDAKSTLENMGWI